MALLLAVGVAASPMACTADEVATTDDTSAVEATGGDATGGATAEVAGAVWVDQAAAVGGDGSEATPFRTIGDATKSVEPGATITVRAGVYHESVRLTAGGTADAPVTLRAAAGERVVLSGFRDIAGWKKVDGNIYRTTVSGAVHDLYVGYIPQQVAQADGEDSPWRALASVDPKAGTVDLGPALRDVAHVEELAADPAGLRVFQFLAKSRRPYVQHVTKIDLENNRLTLQGPVVPQMTAKDVLTLVNHPALIDRPGEWACDTSASGKTTLYFWPHDAGDLERTQSRSIDRPMLAVGHWNHRIGHVRIEGLEITGSLANGVDITDADDVQITDCIVHNNGHHGINTRRSSHVRIAHNIVFGNFENGVVASSTPDVLIEENEVLLNYADGVVVAGDVTRKGTEPASDRAVIRRNYLHHHTLREHPDNLQFYFGVNDVTVQDNLALIAGQGMMTQDVQGGRFEGNIFFGAAAKVLIFGHNSSDDWDITRNTLGLGGWGNFLFITRRDADTYRVQENILYNPRFSGPTDNHGDYNLYWDTDPTQPVLFRQKPTKKPYTDVSAYAYDTGQETHSQQADPLLANVPKLQAVVTNFEQCSVDHLLLRLPGASPDRGFAIGDTIEVNGDGVARTVTQVDSAGIRFTPALPQPPFRAPLVWNWGAGHTDLTPDFTPASDSPAQTMGPDGRAVGASLNTRDYMAGDFNGDGQRDLPTLAQDLLDALPNPNAPVLPAKLP